MFIKKIVKHGSWIIPAVVVVVLCLQFLVRPAHAQTSMTVFYQGLTNPRGLKFGPDGYLYVAEGGPADTNTLSTDGLCTQVPGPIGPYVGGNTSRISKISPDGTQRTTVVDHLPSSKTQPPMNFVSGVGDVAFIGNTLYGIEAGAGCSHGLAGTDNTVFRVNQDGSTTTIADLSQFQQSNPTSSWKPDDYEPDGTWYIMLSIGSTLYAIEPNHGELDRILLNGQIQRVANIAAIAAGFQNFENEDTEHGHIVPTSFAFHAGSFWVGNLNTFPVQPGSSMILQINNGGMLQSTTKGLTTVLGIAFDRQGRMYALESVPDDNFPVPGTFVPGSGRVVRVNDDGTLTIITSGLDFPTAMTFGPDGDLYVSNVGFGVNVPGSGQIMRIAIDN
jgi:hypothetical protein